MSNHPTTKDYEDEDEAVYETSYGEEIEVFPVPQNIIRGITPDTPKPKRPQIEMKIKGGATQKRFAKQGDPEWAVYQEDIEKWEEERDTLQEDVSLVLSVRNYPANSTTILKVKAEELKFPDYVMQLVSDELLEIPNNAYSRKAMWLREKALPQHDEFEIGWLSQELSGTPEEYIEQMKASFRDILSGKTVGNVATDT